MQRRTQHLLVLLLLWLNVLAQGLVVYVGELVTLHCTTQNTKASWYRTTNSSTGKCQQPLIYKDIVLCDHLSQDLVVQGSFRHRFSVLSSHKGRLVTLVLTQAESSDAGRYVCIDFITKNLILQLDLQVLEKSPTSTLSPFMSRISSDALSSHMEYVASPTPISVGNAGDQQKIHISTEKFASDLTLSEFLGKNWIVVVLASGMALLMIVVLLMSVYVVHLRRRLKRQWATTDSLHGAFGDLPSEQTTIIRPLNDGQTVIAFSHPISYLPDVLSTQSFQGSYDYPALLDATGSHDRLGVSHVDLHRDHISSSSYPEMSQNDTNSQREFSFDCRRTENPRPVINVTAPAVITSSCPDRTESADSTSCIDGSNRPPLQEESQLVRAPSTIRRYDVLDEATVPLRTSDDECDYINIRCSGEYLHQRSCSSDDSSSNFHVSLPGVHVESPETTLYANAGELRRVPLHGRNEHKLDTQEQSLLVTSKRQLYPSSLSDLGDILDIIRRAFD